VSRKDQVVLLFAAMEHDAVATYEELGRVLELHPVTHRHLIQAAVQAAKERLLTEHKRSLTGVPHVGYRIRLPEEHLGAAAALQRKAGRSVTMARQQVDGVDLSRLSPEQRKLAMAAAVALGWQFEQLRLMDLRQQNLARIIETVTTRVELVEGKTDARLAELEKRIAELET
jgi:hypothetical protein